MTQVLVAVGDEEVREAVGFALTVAGFSCQEVETGIEALTIMASSARPIVVVLDAQLPDLDGPHILRFAATMLSAGWLSGMVLLTTEPRTVNMTDERALGGWPPQELVKPVSLDALVTAVRVAAARQRSASRRHSVRIRRATPIHDSIGAAHRG